MDDPAPALSELSNSDKVAIGHCAVGFDVDVNPRALALGQIFP